MKLAALALLLCASCSVSAAPPGTPRVRYTVGFAAGSDAALLQQTVDVLKERLGSDATLVADPKASTIAVEFPVSACFREAKPVRELKQELRATPKRSNTLHGSLLKQEKEMIEAALAASQGRISGTSGAAAKLGLPSRTLDSKIKRLRINVYRFKTPR